MTELVIADLKAKLKRILRKIMMVMVRAMIMTKRKMGMILSLIMRM